MKIALRACFVWLGLLIAAPVAAQDAPLSFATVERPPFAMIEDGITTGFSIELMKMIAMGLGREVTFEFYDNFSTMLSAVEEGQHDGAVANISITADRERIFDFTQPIFEGGVGVLLREDAGGNVILNALLTRDFLVVLLSALGLLFGSGMLMWFFERRSQPYFDRSRKDVPFLAFWWALNTVVNGGFEERVPVTVPGRIFSVILVISSLFVVSIFVATISSTMTVEALQNNVDSINDLEGSRIATIDGSTSAAFMDTRELAYLGFNSPADMFGALEEGRIDAIVFDAPILSYYASSGQGPETRLLPRIYRPENYGIVLPAGSDLGEQINLVLLGLRENGTYDDMAKTWFGRIDG